MTGRTTRVAASLSHTAPCGQRPLSLNQDLQLLREWIVHTQSERRPMVVGWMGLEFGNRPDIRRLERALTTIVDRHEILRTSFTEPSSMDSLRSAEIFRRRDRLTIDASLFDQQVRAATPVTVSEGELVGLRRDWISRTLDHEALLGDLKEQFRYDSPPLVRATLFRCEGDRHLLGIAVPHLVTDGWSMRVLRRELAALYGASTTMDAAVQLPPLKAQYADFAWWQRQQLAVPGEATAYWHAHCREFLPALVGLSDIPYARREPTAARESRRVALTFDATCTKELRTFCGRYGVTMHMAWLAATALTLHLYTGRDRVAILGFAANRAFAEWRSLIGWCSSPLIWGLAVPATSGEALLREARQTVLTAMKHQIVPLGFTWHSFIRDGTLPKDFFMTDWISLDYTTVPREPNEGEPWQRPIWSYVSGTNRGPSLAIRITDEGRELTAVCAYPVARFTEADARQVLTDIHRVMCMLMRAPQQPVDAYRHLLGTPAIYTS